MLTFFSTPKPFWGRVGVIQRNAIRSWTRLHPDVEVILFGDEEGACDAAREFGVRHEPNVQRNRHGTKFLAPIYDRAREIARHDLLCHVNCDILLMSDFRRAAESVSKLRDQFLMAGRRWDVDLREPWNFDRLDWEDDLRGLALRTNQPRPGQWIDYFVFRKGLYHHQIPPFVIGRPGWDNWLLWHALSSGVPLVDASSVVCAVHQNHDYSYHPDGEKGVWEGEEAQENYRLLEGARKFRTLEDATFILEPRGLRRNHARWLARAKRQSRKWLTPIWFSFLNLTRPVRHRVGLRQKAGS